MQFIHATEERLLDELKEISNKLSSGEDLSAQCLDNIKDIAIALNQFTTYEAMKNSDYAQNGFSNNGYPSGYSNNDGYSNARGSQMRTGRMMYNNNMNRMSNAMSRDERETRNWYPEEMSYRMRPDMRPEMY